MRVYVCVCACVYAHVCTCVCNKKSWTLILCIHIIIQAIRESAEPDFALIVYYVVLLRMLLHFVPIISVSHKPYCSILLDLFSCYNDV